MADEKEGGKGGKGGKGGTATAAPPKGGAQAQGKGKDKAPAAAVDHEPKAQEGKPRLLDYYEKTIRPRLAKEFGLANPNQVPRLVKIVLNVGIGLGAGLAGTSVADWDLAINVNLRSHFLVCKAALPLMGDDGSIVFLSSVAGFRAGSGSPSYDSTKAGILGLCRHVGREGAKRRIRANVVVPGLMDTPIGRAATSENPNRDRIAALVPLGRQGTAWEVAAATVFLLSGEASYITGQPLVVDGGLTTL